MAERGRWADLAVAMAMVTTCLMLTNAQDGAYVDSQTCPGPSACSLHRLDCGSNLRLAVVQADLGFPPLTVHHTCSLPDNHTCPDTCCSSNSTADCTQPFPADSLRHVRDTCSHRSSCQIRAQTGDNTACSGTRGVTSTYSVLRALCVPDAVTLDPCRPGSVTGQLLSLHLADPLIPAPDTCRCTLHPAPLAANTTPPAVHVTAYDVQPAPGVPWGVSVASRAGLAVMQFSGLDAQFPASSVTVASSSLPLTVTVRPPAYTSGHHRVWLGFSGVTPLTLTCGQDGSTTDGRPAGETRTVSATRDSSTTAAPPRQTTLPLTGESSPPDAAPDGHTGDSAEDGANGLDTTDLIIYIALGIAALIVSGFVYVLVRKVVKKGCPAWCPPACRDLECNKGGSDQHNNNNNNNTTTANNNNSDVTSVHSDVSKNGSVVSNGAKVNGVAVGVSGEGDEEDGYLSPFHHRRSSFDYKRHRSSLHSLRRPSFGDLENITETEEESRFPTHHNHSHLNLHEQEEIFRMVDSKLAPLAIASEGTLEEEDDEVFSRDSGSTATGSRTGSSRDSASTKGGITRDSGNAGLTTMAEAEGEGEQRPVIFRLGGGSESSDPDLERLFTQL